MTTFAQCPCWQNVPATQFHENCIGNPCDCTCHPTPTTGEQDPWTCLRCKNNAVTNQVKGDSVIPEGWTARTDPRDASLYYHCSRCNKPS